MKYKIVYTRSYNRIAAKFLKRHLDLINQYEKTLKLLEINPRHPSLRLHKSSRKWESIYSVSVNIRFRLLIHFVFREDKIIPISIGRRDEVY